MARLKLWVLILFLAFGFRTPAYDDCNTYLKITETQCIPLGKEMAPNNKAQLYYSIDKIVLLKTLERMTSRAKNLLAIEMGSLEKYIDATRAGATVVSAEYGYSQVLSHTLAICEQFQKKSSEKESEVKNSSPALLLEVSLLSDPQMKPWFDGEADKESILKKALSPSDSTETKLPTSCPVQLAKNKKFLMDFNIAMTEKKNHLLQRINRYENMEKMIRESSGDSFAALQSDTEVFLDMFMFTNPSEEPPGKRQRCKYLQVLSALKKSEGFNEAAKESAANAASLLIGPEALVLGTLGKATASLDKIGNLLHRLNVSGNGNLMPRNLKVMARDTAMMRELGVEADLVRDIPEILYRKYNIGYGEFIERIGLSQTLQRTAAASATKTMDTAYRNLLVQEVQALAKKGVSINPKRLIRATQKELLETRDSAGAYTAEHLVSKGVYPNEPRLLLERIEREFGGFPQLVQYMGKNFNNF
ncbi:MAG TPA: hypothetical protein VIG33_17695 [Pseudobdellovibrionaceae bacterium]